MTAHLTLLGYQESGKNQIVAHNGPGVLLADPPGAGKTCQAIVAAKELGAGDILVVCPASLRLNWAREIEMWAGGVWYVEAFLTKSHILSFNFSRPPEMQRGVAFIVSYDHASDPEVLAELCRHDWDLLILDEVHLCKAAGSKRTQACLIDLWGCAKKRIAITGTPIPNGRAAEAWPLFSQMAPKFFRNWTRFREEYCGKGVYLGAERGGRTVYPTSKNLPELGALARQHFMIRRSREECLAELPALVRSFVPVEAHLSDEDRAFFDAFHEGLPGDDEDAKVAALLALFARREELEEDGPVATMRRKLGEAKCHAAAEFIADILAEDEKRQVVVFVYHRSVLAYLDERLIWRETARVSVISGDTPAVERQQAVDDFQSGKTNVFLASITAANTGITLTAADTVVIVEGDWLPSTLEQAEGRIARRGQQAAILRAFYLTVPGTLDEAIMRTVARKQKDIQSALDIPSGALSKK